MFTIIQFVTSLFQNKSIKKGALYLLLVAGFGCIGYFGSSYIYNKGLYAGIEKTNREWDDRVKLAKEEAQRKYDNVRQQLDDAKQIIEKQQVENQLSYEKGKAEAEANAQRIIDDVNARNQRLHIQVRANRNKGTAPCTTGSTAPTKGTYERAELSERSATFLIRQATEADNYVRQLNLCKSTLDQYRDLVKTYNQSIQSKQNKVQY